MKKAKVQSQKILAAATSAFLLLGASGSTMAEGCGDGVLHGEIFDGTLRLSDERSCTIIGSTIGGDLRITNVANVLLINNRVDGEIQVNGNTDIGAANANVFENTVFGGELIVRDYETATVTYAALTTCTEPQGTVSLGWSSDLQRQIPE